MNSEKKASSGPECKACGASLADKPRPRFCSQCGAMLALADETTTGDRSSADVGHPDAIRTISIKDEGVPALDKIQFELGRYQILETIGLGGMGEVYLAFDPVCGRRVALKRIRSDLQTIKKLHSRFLREARVTSQLTHPAIIPIYSIDTEESCLYYTMPYVEGHTLKQILRRGMRQQREGKTVDGLAANIPSLIRIFLSVCHAIAYAHSRGVLHRDIKPENVIVGKYGQITILDWGLAKLISDQELFEEEEEESLTDEEKEKLATPSAELTVPGKVVGTVSYMAPERAKKEPASIQSDIYALGVMLYQILTLRLPFARKGLKDFQKRVDKEVLAKPTQVAPYRDISQLLSRIVTKCLARARSDRYKSVDQIIQDLEGYLEGRSDWLGKTRLDPHKKSDWEFQENVLLTENLAIARHMEVTNWVNLMLSSATFPESIKLEMRVRLGEKSEGLGLLFCVPEGAHRSHLSEGYCVWLSPEGDRGSSLYRSGVEVMNLERCYLVRSRWYDVRIEKIENKIQLYLDDTLHFSYNSHLPLTGSHVGIMSRDGDYLVDDMTVYGGTLSIRVSRLAIPDAFLNAKDYASALDEYRKIGESFPGRQEGREAMFRAGYTLLEWGRQTEDRKEAEELFDRALEEFDRLHETPGAPLQYLGKSLVYKTLHDSHEEINCLELGYRRYRNHPLVDVLEEQILYRMHDNSRLDRHATYRFALLTIQFDLSVTSSPNSKRLFSSIQKHWEPLPFLVDTQDKLNFALQLAFWLAKPFAIRELIEMMVKKETRDETSLGNALFALLELGGHSLARKESERISDGEAMLAPMLAALHCDEKPLEECIQLFMESVPAQITAPYFRTLLHLLDRLRLESEYEHIRTLEDALKGHLFDPDQRLVLEAYTLWSYLLEEKWEEAEQVLHTYPEDQLHKETTPLSFLRGCWLAKKEGEEAAREHFSRYPDFPYPRSTALLGNFVLGRIGLSGEWFDHAFSWEKRQLYAQLTLYAHCLGDTALAARYRDLEQQEMAHV